MTSLEKCLEKYKNDGLIERAAVRVGMGDRVLFEQYLDTDENTLFDMASVTKIVATTMLTLIVLESGELSLGESMRWIFGGNENPMTIKHMLTHTVGFGHKPLNLPDVNYGNVADYIFTITPDIPLGKDVLYSCPAFVLLGKIIERKLGLPLDEAFDKYVRAPLGMSSTCFKPRGGDIVNANKSENECGIVNDYNCRHLGGVAGNAGLFSSIADMTRFVAMLNSNGAPIVTKPTFLNAIRNHTGGMSESRGLGFLVVDGRYYQTGRLFDCGSFGHCGHTGQSVFVDPKTGLYAIILSDATKHSTEYEQVKRFREAVHNAIADDLKI